MQDDPSKCWCGRPLHYKQITARRMVEKTIDEYGAFIKVRLEEGKSYNVQRHYIALHGIRGKNLKDLGFEEIDT